MRYRARDLMPDLQQPPWSEWSGHALVVGGGGIGEALLRRLATRAPGLQLWCAQRSNKVAPGVQVQRFALDVGDEASLEALRQLALARLKPLRLVIYTAGLLHGEGMSPEKRLAQVSRGALERSFSVNAWGPLLVAQAIEAALPRELPSHLASLSARVGSISDNQLGGWYSYRAAKAAQNQLLTTLALEWRRRLPQVCVTLLHPGTTDTPLSAPFSSGVAPEQLFSPDRAAAQLLDLLESQSPATSGRFLAWDGQEIPW